MARHRPWTQDITTLPEVAIIRECASEGVAIEVIESEREWREAHRFPLWPYDSDQRWGRTSLVPVKWGKDWNTGGKMVEALTRGAVSRVPTRQQGYRQREQIVVWSPRMLDKFQAPPFPSYAVMSWAKIVAHELGHVYTGRTLGLTGTLKEQVKAYRGWGENRTRRVFSAANFPLIAKEFGEDLCDEVERHAKMYDAMHRGEEFCTELAAKMWWREAQPFQYIDKEKVRSALESGRSLSPGKKFHSMHHYWSEVNGFVDRLSLPTFQMRLPSR